MLVTNYYLWSEFREMNAMFRPASTDLNLAFVACELTQIVAERSGCIWDKSKAT